MPRPERPVDPDAGVVQGFAVALRELRRGAGSPGYRELARRAHYSATTLAQAARGDTLPSLAVTLAYVRACGGDAAGWETRWRAVADELGCGAHRPELTAGRAPYVGLAAFQATDSEWFFGRDRLVAELADRVWQRRFVGVFGPSGCGKSSLLRAGLVPALAGQPVAVFTPGAQPLDECAVNLAGLVGASAASVRAELAVDPANLHLLVRQVMVDRPTQDDLVLVVDQFEEVFTSCSDRDQRGRFIGALVAAAGAASSRTRVVVGVRADFYGHCAHYADLVDALRDGQVMVGPMCPEQLRQAITGPAVLAGCRVETALVSRLIADATGQPAVLPLVSHALLETWHRRHGTTMTLTEYENAGGIEHALARTAEATYDRLDVNQQQLARRLFQRLTALGDGTEDTRRRVSHDEFDHDGPDTAVVLDALTSARLITLDDNGVQLAHEALIRHWPRLRDWLAEDREGLRIHRQLTEATHTWYSLDRDPGALYRGTRLARISEWANTPWALDLTTREREFLQASIAAQAAEQTAAQRRSRRQHQLIAMLAVLLLLTTGMAGYAINARNTANHQRKLAVINDAVNKIAILGSTEDYSNRQLALALSLAAYRLDPNPRTSGSLISMYHSLELNGLMAFSEDGHNLVNVGTGANVDLVDLTQPDHPRQAHTVVTSLRNTSTPTSVQFAPDGNTLVITGIDRSDGAENAAIGHTILFDIKHRRHLVTLTGTPTHPPSIAPSGHTIALTLTSGSTNEIVRLIDIANPQHPTEIATIAGNAGASAAIFSPDGHTLVTAEYGDPPRLWDLSNPRQPVPTATLTGQTGPVLTAAFSPNGKLLVTSDDGQVRLWDMTDPHNPSQTATLSLARTSAEPLVVLSPDGKTLATVGDDGRIALRDVTDPRRPTKTATLISSTGEVVPFAVFSPDSRTLATFGTNATTLLWDLSNPHQPTERAILTHPTGPVVAAAFSPDGKILATTYEYSQHARLWELDINRIAAETCTNPALPTITQTQWDQFFPGLPHQPRCQ